MYVVDAALMNTALIPCLSITGIVWCKVACLETLRDDGLLISVYIFAKVNVTMSQFMGARSDYQFTWGIIPLICI